MQNVTYDADGNVTAKEVNGITWTVQYSRKMGRENYGNEECGIFAQIEVADDDDHAMIEAKVNATYAFAKTVVLKQLGVESTETGGVIRDLPQEAPAKAAAPARASAPARKKPAAKTNDKTALWQDYVENPNDWWDNRENKRNPKAPDFKHKQSGEGLWLDKAPAFALAVVNGDAEVF